jgi:hypothetical protein
MTRPPRSSRAGFHRVDVAVALLLVVLLTSLALPAAVGSREVDSRNQCSKQLRQIGIGFHHMHDAHGKLPPALGWFPWVAPAGQTQTGSYGNPFFHLLPYVEQDPLYKSTVTMNAEGPVYHPVKGTYGPALCKPISTYLCPADDSGGETHLYKGWLATGSYAVNFQVFGTVSDFAQGNPLNLYGRARIPASFPDGTSSTIMVTERYQLCNGTPNGWGYYGTSSSLPMFAFYTLARFQPNPTQARCNPALPQGLHGGSILCLMGDDHVVTVSNRVSPQIWWYLCTPAGNEVIDPDSY